jgi:hypothetical protein
MRTAASRVYDATRAEYDRFGGVGISMARQSNPQQGYYYTEHPIRVLLLRANDLSFGAWASPDALLDGGARPV